MRSFLYQHDITSPVKEKLCFKSITNPLSIDRFLTNSNLSFQETETVSPGLSDIHVSSYCFKDLFFKKEA